MTPAASRLATAVTTKLAALGDTESAVATALTAAGITGRPWSATTCPVSQYLLDQADLDLDRAYVGAAYITVVARDGMSVEDLMPPAAVSEFITAFDLGGYDQLASGEVQGWQAGVEELVKREVRPGGETR